MRQSEKKNFHIFLHKSEDCVNIFPGFSAVIQITSNNRSVYPIAENFPFFLQLFEVIWEITANSGEILTHAVLCKKNMRVFLHFTVKNLT